MKLTVLDHVRRLQGVMRELKDWKNPYENISSMLSECLDADVMVIDADGHVRTKVTRGDDFAFGEEIPKATRERLLNMLSTNENTVPGMYGFSREGKMLLAPIFESGNRLATLVLFRDATFEVDDVLIAEYASIILATAFGYERELMERRNAHEQYTAESALKSLTHKEMMAIGPVMEQIGWDEGIVVTSKLADGMGITRSALVNAIHKLGAAGVVESRSAGYNGTRIRVLNSKLQEEVKKQLQEAQDRLEARAAAKEKARARKQAAAEAEVTEEAEAVPEESES